MDLLELLGPVPPLVGPDSDPLVAPQEDCYRIVCPRACALVRMCHGLLVLHTQGAFGG